jgi:hypothetical protein
MMLTVDIVSICRAESYIVSTCRAESDAIDTFSSICANKINIPTLLSCNDDVVCTSIIEKIS